MRFLLIALIAFMTLSSVFDWDPGPMPGVKIKNAILYLLALGLLIRIALGRKIKIELPGIHIAFVVLIAYAVLSYFAIVFLIQYPRYNPLVDGLNLKGFIDQLLFFMVFFYGLRSEKDAIFILKCLLAAWTLSHFVALLDALGFVQVGDIEQRADGRVQGLVGESNQYGAFVALSLPAIIAVALATRGFQRFLWGVAALMTAITLVMTVSRGAFVAMAVASVWGLIAFKRYAPQAKLAMWAGAGVLLAVLIVSIAMLFGFADLLYDRLIAESTTRDMVQNSSGRTEIWADAIAAMFREPITLLTGFGWRAYWTMPFRYSPHNYYINQWFNLGLIGLACSLLLFVWPIKTAKAAVDSATAAVRPILIGFAVATLAFAVATFFVDLYIPWLYFWAYAGIVLRLAVMASESAPWQQQTSSPKPLPAQRVAAKAGYGWVVARRS